MAAPEVRMVPDGFGGLKRLEEPITSDWLAQAHGAAAIGADGKVPSEQLPEGAGGGVTSVNAKTGAVQLVAADVGAAAAGAPAAAVQAHEAAPDPHPGYAPESHPHDAGDIATGTLDGSRLPAASETKPGAVPPLGTPVGKVLHDDGTFKPPTGGDPSPALCMSWMEI